MNLDDRIRGRLNNAAASPPRPINDLRRRARRIHNRRRAATTGVVLVAAAAVAFPFAMTGTGASVTDDAANPATTASTNTGPEPNADDQVPCESWSGNSEGRHLTLEEVPDHMRLLWDMRLAESPTSARAIDWSETVETVTDRSPEGCVVPDEEKAEREALTLLQTDDNVVTNSITIHGPEEVGPERFQQVEHHTVATQVGPMRIVADRDRAFWPAGENQYWAISYERSMSDMALVELAEAVRLRDGRIDVSQWSGYDSALSASPLEGPELRGIEVDIQGPIAVRLASERSRDELWYRAYVDDEVVDINGQPGILSPARGHVDFLTDESVLVQVRSHGLATDELLTIARSIEEVPADDPRLVSAWQAESP